MGTQARLRKHGVAMEKLQNPSHTSNGYLETLGENGWSSCMPNWYAWELWGEGSPISIRFEQLIICFNVSMHEAWGIKPGSRGMILSWKGCNTHIISLMGIWKLEALGQNRWSCVSPSWDALRQARVCFYQVGPHNLPYNLVYMGTHARLRRHGIAVKKLQHPSHISIGYLATETLTMDVLD